jgi:magnesium transporter
MIVDCALYQEGVRTSEATSVSDAARLMHEPQGFVWLAFNEPGPHELREVGAAFDLPVQAVEHARRGHPRPKLEQYRESVFVVLKTVRSEDGMHLIRGELDIFVAPRYAIVMSRSAAKALTGARDRLEAQPEVTAHGPMAALWSLLDTVIADAEEVADLLVDEGERIGQAVFQGDDDQSQRIYEHDHRAERLGRVIHPILAIFDTLEHGELVRSPDRVRPLLRDAGDHARRLSEEIEMLSARLDGLLHANLARVTVRQNVIVQKVSAWAAIAAVPTIITGIYGMNFHRFPELDWAFGYPLALAIMIFAVVALRWNFRRAGWL